MAKTISGEAEGWSVATTYEKYEPPVLTPLGNARDLLAGSTGPYADATPDPENPMDGQDHP
jgi:hypothetical protein